MIHATAAMPGIHFLQSSTSVGPPASFPLADDFVRSSALIRLVSFMEEELAGYASAESLAPEKDTLRELLVVLKPRLGSTRLLHELHDLRNRLSHDVVPPRSLTWPEVFKARQDVQAAMSVLNVVQSVDCELSELQLDAVKMIDPPKKNAVGDAVWATRSAHMAIKVNDIERCRVEWCWEFFDEEARLKLAD
jgi:hypothetical protein